MKYVRTARGYQSLKVTADGKQVNVTAVPQEVSNKAADEILELAEVYGVNVVVSDDEPDARTLPVNQVVPDLSRGVSAMSGTGQPVSTNDGPTDASLEATAETQQAADQAPAGATNRTASTGAATVKEK